MRIIESIVLVLLVLLSGVAPVLRLLKPTGPYPVGTTTLSMGRPDPFTVQLWYPASPSAGARRASYSPQTGGWRDRVWASVRTWAWQDAPFVAGNERFPVLIYIPGWGGDRWQNSSLLQDLASHGYVVAAADQPTGTIDGVDISSEMDFSSPNAWARTQRVIAVKLRVQIARVTQLLDELADRSAQRTIPFADRLDLDRVGTLGFSFGGATAAEASCDPRVRAVINMDGLLFGKARETGVPVPFLAFSDDTTPDTNAPDTGGSVLASVQDADTRHLRAGLARHGGYYITILNAVHPNFSDYPILVPLRRLNGAGAIPPRNAARLIAAWTVGFFDHALKNQPLPDPSETPDILFEAWPKPEHRPRADQRSCNNG
jgi:dienelactone hydrolase